MLLGIALGAAALTWLKTRPHNPPQRKGRQAMEGNRRDDYPGPSPGTSARLNADALADEASEDSFPASDPPARMGILVLGSPARS
jgi:hypothetical protein